MAAGIAGRRMAGNNSSEKSSITKDMGENFASISPHLRWKMSRVASLWIYSGQITLPQLASQPCAAISAACRGRSSDELSVRY